MLVFRYPKECHSPYITPPEVQKLPAVTKLDAAFAGHLGPDKPGSTNQSLPVSTGRQTGSRD